MAAGISSFPMWAMVYAPPPLILPGLMAAIITFPGWYMLLPEYILFLPKYMFFVLIHFRFLTELRKHNFEEESGQIGECHAT